MEMLLAVDELLATLVDTLRARGELDSTYIMFVSDNGLHYGEHRLLKTKLTPYDASARVPLLVRGPGVQAGKAVDALTLLADVAPTLADLAGAPKPTFVDGRSLVPWLGEGGARGKARQQVLLEFWPRTGFPVDEREEADHTLKVPEYRALRSAHLLYAEYLYPNGSQEPELYDLRQDPFELENIAETANPSLLRDLSTKLRELQRCQAAGCRAAEDRVPEVN